MPAPDPDPPLPPLTHLVLRPTWSTHLRASLIPSGLILDRLPTTLPTTSTTLTISSITRHPIHYHILTRTPPLSTNPLAPSLTLVPALPPSLTQPLSLPPSAPLLPLLSNTLIPTLKTSSLTALALPPPSRIILTSPPGAGTTTALAAVASVLDAPLLRYTPAEILGAAVTSAGILPPLLAAAAAANAARPAILLLDDAHFLFPPDGDDDAEAEERARALVEAADLATKDGRVAVVVVEKAGMCRRAREGFAEVCVEVGALGRDGEWALRYAVERVWGGEGGDFDGVDVSGRTLGEVFEAVHGAGVDGKFDRSRMVEVLERDRVVGERGSGISVVMAGQMDSAESLGKSDASEMLRETLRQHTAYLPALRALSLAPARGVVLYGPTGVGKTRLVRLATAEASMALISLDAATVARGSVGASEAVIRAAYARAAEVVPAVVFLDEADALFHGNGPSRLSAALAGVLDRGGAGVVTVLATNTPWVLPKTLMRGGRLERVVHVALPCAEERAAIGSEVAQTAGLGEMDAVSVGEVARSAVGCSGADIAGAVRMAFVMAAAGKAEDDSSIVESIGEIRASVSVDDSLRLAAWRPCF